MFFFFGFFAIFFSFFFHFFKKSDFQKEKNWIFLNKFNKLIVFSLKKSFKTMNFSSTSLGSQIIHKCGFFSLFFSLF